MSEIPFAFHIGGQDIDPGRSDDEQQTAALNRIVESIVDRTGELVCPEHGEPPRFICTGPDFDNLSLEVQGCCEALVSKVRLRLAD